MLGLGWAQAGPGWAKEKNFKKIYVQMFKRINCICIYLDVHV